MGPAPHLWEPLGACVCIGFKALFIYFFDKFIYHIYYLRLCTKVRTLR